MKETRFAKLHPALCFAFLIAAICFAVVIQHPAYLAVSLLCALCLNISLSGKKALRSFLMYLPLWAFIAALNPVLNTLGNTVLFTYFGRPYTWEALCYGMVAAGMFIAMLIWFSAYNAVMTEDKFSYLFGSLAPSTALLLTTVLRMIPNLMRKAGQIMNARKCIGMGAAESATKKEKITNGMTTLSVLTTWALEGSVVTADSMNSRGYGVGRRSCFHSYRLKAEDIATGLVSILLCAITIAALAKGGSRAEYWPGLSFAQIAGKNLCGLSAYALFLLIPTILNLKEEIQWHISRSRI